MLHIETLKTPRESRATNNKSVTLLGEQIPSSPSESDAAQGMDEAINSAAVSG